MSDETDEFLGDEIIITKCEVESDTDENQLENVVICEEQEIENDEDFETQVVIPVGDFEEDAEDVQSQDDSAFVIGDHVYFDPNAGPSDEIQYIIEDDEVAEEEAIMGEEEVVEEDLFEDTVNISENSSSNALQPMTSIGNHEDEGFGFPGLSKRKEIKQEIDPEMIMPVADFPYFIKKEDIEAGLRQASEDKIQVVYAASQEDEDEPTVEVTAFPSASRKKIGVNDMGHLCPVCGKKFMTSTGLREHERVHRGERPYVCTLCNKSFALAAGLAQHEKIHLEGRRFVCNICGKGFARKEVLKNHIRSHTGEKPFPCELCGKCFSRKAILKKHEASHVTDKYYQCNGCGKSFMDQSQITVAFDQLICSLCGDSLTTVLFIKNKEEQIETEQRPFHCSFCGKGFKLYSNMKCHERIHLGQRPFKCSYCFKTFTTSSNLKVHERLHTGVKPYVCSVCGKGFITTSNLKLHLKGHVPREDEDGFPDPDVKIVTDPDMEGIFVEV